jgi:hypothetical protein
VLLLFSLCPATNINDSRGSPCSRHRLWSRFCYEHDTQFPARRDQSVPVRRSRVNKATRRARQLHLAGALLGDAPLSRDVAALDGVQR